jgi:hypothetical protein
MAHYALLKDGIVVQVITGVDENIIQIDENGNKVGGSTEAWESFYSSQPWNKSLTCKRASYNAAENDYRGKYAGIGDVYDSTLDKFVSLKEESLENEF